jgi:FlaA1/EpsC-like NDP-sugar epimerase
MSSMFRHFCSVASSLLSKRAGQPASLIASHALLAALAGQGAFLLRYEFGIPPSATRCAVWSLATWCLVKPFFFYRLNTVTAWGHFSVSDLTALLKANFFGSALAFGALAAFCPVPVPRSIVVLDIALCILLTAGARVITRMLIEHSAFTQRVAPKRTLIYGAGEAGILLLQESRRNPRFNYQIFGFIDDMKYRHQLVQGVRILGRGEDLKGLVAEHKVERVLIAIPSADSAQMFRMTSLCQDAGVEFRTMPSLSEILACHSHSKDLREVAVDDVLGRSSVRLDDADIRAKIAGKVVLVTGAAGSIGSELCRQVARHGPSQLVAFELSETGLFFLESEMNGLFPALSFCAEVGNIQNSQRVREVFARYLPSVVFHAAAYKHVPLMEKHIFEAVENNVFGTHNVACAAADYGVDDFVMISSDKAVNPTNMMGTTKRVAELVVRSQQNSGTRFVSVRFGNVLGSNGSVLPIFKKQIAAGGPVTVTHPDMERFFMTIPEASQLVLQACTMGRGGEIFVLEMGKPVKVIDLARQLIHLSGFKPDIDIKIQFTGIRPGEKLREEINLAHETLLSTPHEKIKIFSGSGLNPERISLHLHRLRKCCEQRNALALLAELQLLVPEYAVSEDVQASAMSTDSLTKLDLALRSVPHGEPLPPGASLQSLHGKVGEETGERALRGRVSDQRIGVKVAKSQPASS